jgi:protoporphyrinogen oxidase
VSESADLIVLGAGPAGLAAAWRAARAGLSTIVLERGGAVGGMAASFPVGGIRVDHGSHRLHPATAPGIMADLSELLGGDLQLRRRHGRLRVAGHWVGFPLRGGQLARTLPPSMLARVGVEALAEPVRRLRPGPPGSYADALRRGLGPTLYDAVYAQFAVKLWGLSGDEIDVEQARVRVSADSPWKIARRLLRRGVDGPGRSFYYPRLGFGQIVEALAGAATESGADIRLNTEVNRLRSNGSDGSDGTVEVHTAAGESLTARHLFTTIPLPALARIADPPAPAAALESAGRLRFRAMLLIYTVLDGRPWSEYDATYLPDADTPITRICEPPNYRDSAEDPADRTVLCSELPCSTGDQWWSASDAELGALVTGTAARLGLPAVRPTEVYVRRLRHVYPVYETGYAEHLRELDQWAGALPNVTTFGRLGLFAHDNTHHAIAMGYDAVDAIAGGRWDAEAWSTARARFATHVVED